MADALGSLENAALALGRLARTLVPVFDSADPAQIVKSYVANLGWSLPDPVPPALLAVRNGLADLADKVGALEDAISANAGDAALLAAAAGLAEALVNLVKALQGLPAALNAQLPPAFVAATNFPNAFADRFLGTLIADGLSNSAPLLSRVLRLIGLIEIAMKPADAAHFQPAFKLRAVHWDRIGRLLSDPVQLMKDVYGWGSPAIDIQPLQDALFSLSFGLGFPGTYDFPSQGLLKAIAPAVASPKPDRSFAFTLFDFGALANARLLVTTTPKANALEGQGLAVAVTTSAGLDKISIPLDAHLSLDLGATMDASAGVAVVLRPGQPIQAIANFDGPAAPAGSGELTATVSYVRQDAEDPFAIVTLPGGSGLQAREIHLTGGVARNGQGTLNPKVEASLRKGRLSIGTDGADGFVSSFLPPGGVNLDFDFDLGWSRDAGIYVQGAAGLEIAIPLHVELGPVELQTLNLKLAIDGGSIPIEVSLSFDANLGPLQASVDRMGLTVVTAFPAGGGNLGPADVSLGFKPPNGLGLLLNAGVVAGGGYLSFDTDRGQYAGALQLMFADFLAVSAIGIIETKKPDGSPGFSLIVIVTADFGPGIQLGFGFTLLAVGGLLGLNRYAVFQAIADGVRTNAISSVMFPTDAIANAPRIVSDLETFFPARDGTFLIGPMAKLGWGEPTLVSLALAVIIEIPPGDFAILGVLAAALPAEDLPILKLQVNFIGAFEFDKQRLWFYASLYDSHLLFITIEGSMGVLFDYSHDTNFVISVGGFHPQFNPPPLPFPTPTRISIDIVNESFARIHADGYFAVTTNTVQFGTNSSYFFGFSALNVQGSSSFDALIQISPFHFTVSFSTSFSVDVFGVGAYSVGISLTVSGPGRWHASGTASISLLFFSIGVNIDVSWGDDQPAQLPPVQVMPLLAAELQKQSNWRAVLPPTSNLLVSLRKLDPSEAQFVLHPVGTLQVSERLAPLDLTLDTFGSQKPSDANRFSLSVLSPGLTKTRDITQPFAKAQFVALDDAAKLSEPAYDPLDSGIELAVSGNAYASGTAITRIVRYDVTIIDTKLFPIWTLIRFFRFAGGVFRFLLRGASVAYNPLSNFRARQTHPFTGSVVLAPEKFAVALTANNTVFSAEAVSFTSAAAANDFLAQAVKKDPTLAGTIHVLPRFELAA